MKSSHKEAALKILIHTANQHDKAPQKVINETKLACDRIVKDTEETAKSFPELIEHQTKYWNRVKYWLDRKDLTAF